VPLPAIVSSALSDLDERTIFPSIPAAVPMTGSEVSSALKPLVAVITPARRMWFSRQESPSWSLGAGILLRANADGYLFATAHHVVDGENWRSGNNQRALVAMASGVWAGADVIASHKSLDLALLWVPRQSGFGDFVQPIAPVAEGQSIFVIGHPAGLRFTLSNGLVSRMQQSILQISAPVSPGNSGGPVFDEKGNLVGIVVSKMDRSADPNAENLNFAITAGALLEDAGWNFNGNGRQRLKEYEEARAQDRPSTIESPASGASSHKNQDKPEHGKH
jgi:S1-C subfamily serine protease